MGRTITLKAVFLLNHFISFNSIICDLFSLCKKTTTVSRLK